MTRKILIVDDDFGIREILRKVLHRAGYQVEEAFSGVEALQKIRGKQYDLITMDIAMGDLDGVDTIAVIRSETDIPIVAISANLTTDIRADLRDRQVDTFLDKPFSPRDVLAVVRSTLGES